MRLSTFLVCRVLLPFLVVGAVFLSIWLFNAWADSGVLPVAFVPALSGMALLFWFLHAHGYCPKCHRRMGKNIGRSCRGCGQVYAKDDIVSKTSG